jgi:hypothetical protein
MQDLIMTKKSGLFDVEISMKTKEPPLSKKIGMSKLHSRK